MSFLTRLGGLLAVGLALSGSAGEIRRFELTSEYLKGAVGVEVLLPDHRAADERYPVVYVLAAEPGVGPNRGLAELARLDLANRHRVICVGVNFDTMPWYGNHASDPGIRHEDHLVRAVVPRIDREFPTQAARDGRWLLGFSKAGWGAFTLLLRNPEVFGFAASWDAPLMFAAADFGTYKTAPHFGTAENFARYLPAVLARDCAPRIRGRARLVLAGSAFFGPEPGGRFAGRPHTETMHRLLEELEIPHRYDPVLACEHRWNSGWIEPVLAHLAAIARAPETAPGRENGQRVQ